MPLLSLKNKVFKERFSKCEFTNPVLIKQDNSITNAVFSDDAHAFSTNIRDRYIAHVTNISGCCIVHDANIRGYYMLHHAKNSSYRTVHSANIRGNDIAFTLTFSKFTSYTALILVTFTLHKG